MCYPLGKNSEKPLGGGIQQPPPPPLYVEGYLTTSGCANFVSLFKTSGDTLSLKYESPQNQNAVSTFPLQ